MVEDYKRVAIDEFTRITKYNISIFFVRIEAFLSTQYNDIVNFYSGTVSEANSNSFNTLKILLSESEKINQLFIQNKEQWDRFYFWDLMDNFETIRTNLETISNISKYLRSSRTKDSYLSNPEVDYTIQQHDTLEKIENSIDSVNSDNDWTKIALRNDLREEDYNSRGGKDIKLPLAYNGTFLNSVIDNLDGEKLYGKDIKAKLNFLDDDLEVLGYKETVKQSLNTLVKLYQGDIPQLPTLGLDQSVIVGNSLSNFRLPVILRQMKEVFATDDGFVNFSIKKIQTVNDSIEIEFEVNTVLGEILKGTTNL